jgi:2-haloalkanoic acid dehalogenase type II
MSRISGIKAISFDMDGTLSNFDKVMRDSLRHVLEELKQIDAGAARMLDIERMIEIRDRVGRDLKGKVTDLGEVRLEAFRQTLKDVGNPDEALASHLNRVFLKHRFENIRLFDDVIPTLKALQPRYALGLISNGNTYPRHCGLEGAFQFAVFSQDHGIDKPQPKIFQIALEKAGCSEDELLHVGDSVEDDIRGALDAGIKCIWLNRNRARNSSNLNAIHEISSLLELIDLL